VEPGGDVLLLGRPGQQVPGDLLHREAVEGQVPVEGPDDPVAVGPHLAVIVEVQAVGVGVAGRVEPVARAVLTPLRGVHEAIDPALVGVGARIAHELLDPFGTGRQAGEVEGGAPREGAAIGLRVGLETLGLEARQNERIETAPHPCGVFHRRQGCLLGLEERPVRLPVGPLEDPALHDLLLGRGEVFMGLGRGHDLVGVGADESLPEGALAEVTGHDGRPALGGGGEEPLLRVEPEAGLAGARIRAMAVEAGVGQDGPEVAVETHRLGRVGGGAKEASGKERRQNPSRGRGGDRTRSRAGSRGVDDRNGGLHGRLAETISLRTSRSQRPFDGGPARSGHPGAQDPVRPGGWRRALNSEGDRPKVFGCRPSSVGWA